MAEKTSLFIKDILLVFMSSLMLVLSFPSFNLGFLAWVGLVPLILAICDRSPKIGFFLALVCGTIFNIGIFKWILEVPKFTLPHYGVMVVYMGTYFGFFGLIFCFVTRKWGLSTSLMTAPFVWVSLEYIKSNMSFLALSWALLAHSQYRYTSIIQFASVTGAYGVSFLIVMVNMALAATILIFLLQREQIKQTTLKPPSSRVTISLMLACAVLIGLAWYHGQMTITRPISGKGIKVAIVQGNIEQTKKWDRKYAKFIMQTYADLTKEAAKNDPELIIWPETATPRSISTNRRLRAEVMRITREAGTNLLLGSSEQQKFEIEGSRKLGYLNSAFLIPSEKENSKYQRYDKIRLFPFGDYLPYKGILPWSFIGVPNISGYMPGVKYTVLKLPNVNFGVTICWENIFSDLVRQFVKNGAQFMVNMTNEAWFGRTAAPYQFVSMSVFRAVENRVYVVRCANTGVSCIIDPNGKVVDRVKDENGKDIFVRGVLTGSIIPSEKKTFYTRYGDWPAWLSLLFTVVLLFVTIIKKTPGNRAEDDLAAIR